MDGQFNEPVGNFDGSGAAFDRALLATSCGLFGLLAISFIREKFIFTYPVKLNEVAQEGLFKFYQNHRKVVLLGFVILFSIVAVTNLYFGIYQRGAIPRTILPYVSLPGIMAFCFYPGSFLFLFGCMFILGAIAAAVEISIFKLGGENIILCSLLAQVVAYRFAHFGYVPSQSYLLFGALFLNLFVIYFSNEFLLYWSKRKA